MLYLFKKQQKISFLADLINLSSFLGSEGQSGGSGREREDDARAVAAANRTRRWIEGADLAVATRVGQSRCHRAYSWFVSCVSHCCVLDFFLLHTIDSLGTCLFLYTLFPLLYLTYHFVFKVSSIIRLSLSVRHNYHEHCFRSTCRQQ